MLEFAASQGTESVIEAYPERANLYRLTLEPEPARLYAIRGEVHGETREEIYFAPVGGAKVVDQSIGNMRRALQGTILAALRRTGYTLSARFPLVVDTSMDYAPGGKSLQIHPAFNLRIMCFAGSYFMCLDHQLVVRSVLSLASLTKKCSTFQLSTSQRLVVRVHDEWREGILVDLGSDTCRISLISGEDADVPGVDVIPRLTRTQISTLAPPCGMSPVKWCKRATRSSSS